MSLQFRAHFFASRRIRPLGAMALSLATVLSLTALVGLAFLPHELRQVERLATVILQHHPLANGRSIELLRRKQPGLAGRFVWEVRATADSGASQVLFRADEPLLTAVDAARNQVLIVSFSGAIRELDLARDQEARPLGRLGASGLYVVHFSPANRMLVASQDATVRAWSVATRRECWSRDNLDARQLVIDDEAARLLVGTNGGELLELDLGTGQTLRTIPCAHQAAFSLAVSSDGTRVARVGGSGRIELLDRATGRSHWPPGNSHPRAGFAPFALAFSPCDKVIVALAPLDLSTLIVWDAATGEPVCELRGHIDPITGFGFTTDGELRSWGLDGVVRQWNLTLDPFESRVAAPRNSANNVTPALQFASRH